jgi:phosphoglycolate phosphatase-like HAD superfamily hydrolase
MQVLALDFDGVLCDSSREVFVVAVDTFADLEPSAGLLDELTALRENTVAGGGEYRDASIYGRFIDLLPLGNRAEDFGVSLRAIDEGVAIGDQAAYDDFYRALGQPWLDTFHSRFYECRAKLREADPEGWLRLHLPYPGLADALRRHTDHCKPAVATAKDSHSVRLLLDELGFGGVFERELILDKETGVEKTHHLRALRERTNAEFTDITFVDDKVNHLVRVAELGVRPVLAGWGFNSDREHELARELGFEVADLSRLDAILFKGE